MTFIPQNLDVKAYLEQSILREEAGEGTEYADKHEAKERGSLNDHVNQSPAQDSGLPSSSLDCESRKLKV